MMVVEGQDVKVLSDETGAIIICDWICPYCEEKNVLSSHTRNVAGITESFALKDVACENCNEKSMIVCKNATRTYKIEV